MEFKGWLVMEDMRSLARAYSDALRDVPQNLEHHPEGDVLAHVKLVRRSVASAADELQRLKSDPVVGPILANIDFKLNEEEIKTLNLAAWLHDIGKASATTIGGDHWRDAQNKSGKIQAIGHETEQHYGPQIDKLVKLAPKSLSEFYFSNRDLLHFLIDRHMDFAHGGFGKGFLSSYFVDGKLKSDPYVKLLLVLMWADKMGRGKSPNLSDNVKKLAAASERSVDMTRRLKQNAERQSKPFSGGEEEFRDMLRKRGLSDNAIDAAVKSKFG
jgi:hypothetical protein